MWMIGYGRHSYNLAARDRKGTELPDGDKRERSGAKAHDGGLASRCQACAGDDCIRPRVLDDGRIIQGVAGVGGSTAMLFAGRAKRRPIPHG